LQEPLRMVNGYMELLKQRYAGNLDKDADEFINFAVDGATRMQQMINDLLVFSRVQTRGKELVATDPNAALENAIENLEMAIEDSSAEITRARMPAVLADATQLTMLFQNLLSNAIKFRKPNEPPVVKITHEGDDKSLTVCVTDNGIGIDPQFFEKIFAIFRKLHTRGEYPGTGIGLAVGKRIVARHGGKIWVESTPDNGSRFFFTLLKPQGGDR
jgi:light-regulated signal transduction histidine kinase (bacteriophytochrome)